jgi:hypothetical protein
MVKFVICEQGNHCQMFQQAFTTTSTTTSSSPAQHPNDNTEPSVVGGTGDVALASTAAVAAYPPQQFTVRR